MHSELAYVVTVPPDLQGSINAMYGRIYRAYEAELGPYYRALYHIFKFIDKEHDYLTEDEKIEYANVARARLSRYEIAMLFYNCLTDRGEKFRPLIEKYGILKHLNDDDLKRPEHRTEPTLYRQTAFMNQEQREAYRAQNP